MQARMNSRRFPGKVLAPYQNLPVIYSLFESLTRERISAGQIVLLTSGRSSDDPLAIYAESLGIQVFRGSLNNVFQRFQDCLKAHPCHRFVRICADSPLLCPELIEIALDHAEETDADLVTNVYQRTFPKGQSVEVLKSATFMTIDGCRLSENDKEHVTPLYYRHPDEFKIVSMRSLDPNLQQLSLAIDTLEDLRRLEREPPSSDLCDRLMQQVVFERIEV